MLKEEAYIKEMQANTERLRAVILNYNDKIHNFKMKI